MRLRSNPAHAAIRPLVQCGVLYVILGGAAFLTLPWQAAFILTCLYAALSAAEVMMYVEEYIWLSQRRFPANHNRVIADLRHDYGGRGLAICLYGDQARKQYRSMGYRWYHVMPGRVRFH